MGRCSTVVALFTTPAIPLTQTRTTVLGQSIRAWPVSFLPGPPFARIRTQRPNVNNPPTLSRNANKRHHPAASRHTSVISPQHPINNGQP